MFEHKTFEAILSDMLSYVNERNSELDTREGSIIYTALAPIALELETAYHEMDMILDETFLETASKEYLVKHGDQIGLNIHEATYGHFYGEFDVDVGIGSRFNLEDYNYAAITKISDPTDDDPYYLYDLVCETAGTEPNSNFGDLTPITFVPNLTHAKLISAILYGEDEEATEAFRYRLRTHIKNPPIDGNVYQYEEWLNQYSGIGKFRIIPCWNGKNTVKLVVLNSEDRGADTELISQVQNYFDPPDEAINDTVADSSYPQGRGMGNGVAPIGAIVTVDTVTEVPVVVNCTVTLKDGYPDVYGVKESIEEYFKSTVLEKTNVAYMPLSAAIYNVECVADIVSLSITVNNITMDSTASPFVNSVSIGDLAIAVLDTENSVWSVANG